MIRILQYHTSFQEYLTWQPTTKVDDCLWVDLCAPSEQEKQKVAQHFELGAFEPRLKRIRRQPNWQDGMRGEIVFRLPIWSVQPGEILCFLTGQHLFTIQNGVDLWPALIEDEHNPSTQPGEVVIAILETLLIRLTEQAEDINRRLDDLSQRVFIAPQAQKRVWRRSLQFRSALREVGQIGAVCVTLNEKIHWYERVPLFLETEGAAYFSESARLRLRGIRQDAVTLLESVLFIQQQNTLVLDAALGIINLEENFVMRWLTVIATIFIPPTLIASVYGMNFAEISTWGGNLALPLALGLLLLSGLIPVWFFLRRGWL